MANYLLPTWMIRLGEKVAKVPFAKRVLKPIYYPYKEWLNKKRNQKFLSNGMSVIRCFDETLTSAGIPYMLGFGTLLGAVREHGFIKHDMDIDTCLWYEDYYAKDVKGCLERSGFKMSRCFTIDDGKCGLETTFFKDGVGIDIFLIYPAVDRMPYTCHEWLPVKDGIMRQESMEQYGYLIPYRLEMPYVKDLIRVDFNGIMLPIPSNYDELLTYRYGKDYMIPNPNYVTDYKVYKCWRDKKAVLQEY